MADPAHLETDSRFPSGRWIGYFLQKQIPGKHQMELLLTFTQGVMTGEGRDWVGSFIIRGKYQVEDGKCWFTKRYVGKHDVYYNGFNEGKGIWGGWEIPPSQNLGVKLTGGFHIWPEDMGDPTLDRLEEEAEVPAPAERELAPVSQQHAAPAQC